MDNTPSSNPNPEPDLWGKSAPAAAAAAPAAGGLMRWLPWLILGLAVLGLVWWMLAGRQPAADEEKEQRRRGGEANAAPRAGDQRAPSIQPEGRRAG